MAEFVENILTRPNYRKNVRPGIDSGKFKKNTLHDFRLWQKYIAYKLYFINILTSYYDNHHIM